MPPFATPRSRSQLACLTAAAVWVAVAAMAWRAGLVGDEWIHFPQVMRMVAGEWGALDPQLTTPPGYHAGLALAMRLLGADSLGAARWLSALAGAMAVIAFHAVRREATGDRAALATAQFALLPPWLPFVFLVYTDVAALAMVLGAFWLALRRHHVLAAALLLAALAVRQTVIVWAAFIAAWSLRDAARAGSWREWRAMSRVGWPYLGVAIAFCVAWALQGRISVSAAQAAAHPDLGFHVGNLYFALALLAALMPLHLALGVRRFVARARARPAWWLLPAGLLALFFAAFAVDHPYNAAVPWYNVRNALLLVVDAQPVAKAAFGVLATLSACALAGNGTAAPQGWLLFPFAAAVLTLAWLIEPRYALVPIALWLALRRRESAPVEGATLALWAALAVYFASGVFDYRFMI